MSSDGTMYLDLDHENAVSSNGTHPDYANIQSSVEANKSPMASTHVKDSPENQLGLCSEEAKTEQDISLVKKKIKPPMPPTKEAKPSAAPVKNDELIDKVCNIFFHPSKPFIQSLLVIVAAGWPNFSSYNLLKA